MLQLLRHRLPSIFGVCLAIIFVTHFGMRMVKNSELPEPDFNWVRNATAAWKESRTYTSKLFSGDLGRVSSSGTLQPITTLLRQSYTNSLGLLLTALALAAIIGLLTGIAAALARHKPWVLLLLMATIIGISAPSFFAAILLQRAEIKYVNTFGKPLVAIAGFGWDFRHMAMPVLVLAARPLAYITRATFIGLGRVLQTDYIRTARAKGLPLRRIISPHALANTAVPILTAIGVSLRFSLSSLPVVEFFFLWPGLGLRLLQAVNSRQTTFAVTLALALGFTFLIINLLLDIAYRFIDPRVRSADEAA